MPARFAVPDEDDRQSRNEVFVEHVGGLLLEVADKNVKRWRGRGQIILLLGGLVLRPARERAKRKPERGRSAVPEEFSTAHAAPKNIRMILIGKDTRQPFIGPIVGHSESWASGALDETQVYRKL